MTMWTDVKYGDHTYKVPATGPKENLEAMLTEIPGQDDVVTPLALHDQRFYRWCMAFLLQDGDLDVPGGRYGLSTRTCAEVAIAMSLIFQYHNGESITYHQLNSDMGAVVNSSDDVAQAIREWAGIIGLDAEDYLSEEDLDKGEPVILKTTYTVVVYHRQDDVPEDFDHAMREIFDGSMVGACTGETVKVVDHDNLREQLISIGNDGEFFNEI
jgi:hypothetical protein